VHCSARQRGGLLLSQRTLRRLSWLIRQFGKFAELVSVLFCKFAELPQWQPNRHIRYFGRNKRALAFVQIIAPDDGDLRFIDHDDQIGAFRQRCGGTPALLIIDLRHCA
jgi:hypothetical protein